MLAFAQEGLDHSVKRAEEVEALLAVPSLGVIPLQQSGSFGAYGLRMAYGLRGRGNGTAEVAVPVALSVVEKPNSIFAEAYRSLRTAILLSFANRPPRTLLITSAQAGDGKTTSSLNLAAVLAQRKGPVLLDRCRSAQGGSL